MAERNIIPMGLYKMVGKLIRNETMSTSEIRREFLRIGSSDVSSQWLEFPDAVRFAPTDLELLGYLEEKIVHGNSASHIDEFIPTIEEAEGISYTHPSNLPGIKSNGRNSFFFHSLSNAPGAGRRKHRKISKSDDTVSDEFTWRKTGNDKCILDSDGATTKGWKGIFVLEARKKGGGTTKKGKWTQHQYSLDAKEDAEDVDIVVSKVFLQSHPKQTRKSQEGAVDDVETKPNQAEVEDPAMGTSQAVEDKAEEEHPGLSLVQLMAEAEDQEVGTPEIVQDKADAHDNFDMWPHAPLDTQNRGLCSFSERNDSLDGGAWWDGVYN